MDVEMLGMWQIEAQKGKGQYSRNQGEKTVVRQKGKDSGKTVLILISVTLKYLCIWSFTYILYAWNREITNVETMIYWN